MLNWYALHTKSNCEEQIARHLRSCDVECFYPHRIVPAAHAKRETILKFFPGYLLARFCLENRVWHPAVIRVITDGAFPAVIPDIEIASIKLMVSAPIPVSPCAYVVRGDRVRVRYGALAGVVGVVQYRKGKCRVFVNVELAGGSMGAEVDAEALELIQGKKLAA
jgi:transcription antitermination factor NusG